MSEKFDKMIEIDQEELMLDKMAKDFNQPEIPLKIQKVKLLETVGLPISKMDFIKKENLDDLVGAISERLKHQDCPLIIRFACIPDKFSMPFFYLEKEMGEEEKNKIVENIYSLIKNDSTIKCLILQDATPADSAKDKISGRVSFEKGAMMPIQEVLEIYKGARSTGVLNNVDVNDPNFRRFIKKAGEFIKPTKDLGTDSSIKEEEIREIYNFLKMYQEKIETIIDVITRSQKKSANDMTVSLEFSCRDGKILFSDIDF
ncbi:MAG: hypothetical protein ABH818_01810 [Patescibacteria group bacterium]